MITCVYPDGVKTHLRHVSVGTILLDRERTKVLLVKRSPQSHVEPNKLDIPGGNMDLNETTKETALREIREETGYEATIIDLFCINDIPNNREERQNVEFIYLAEIADKIGESDRETTEAVWFDWDSIPSEDEIAFNRYKDLQLYQEYRKKEFTLPYVRSMHT